VDQVVVVRLGLVLYQPELLELLIKVLPVVLAVSMPMTTQGELLVAVALELSE
jgi:hypothetical protein